MWQLPAGPREIATFEPVATFGNLVRAEGIRRGADHVRQLTVLGDGAAWIWNIATDRSPRATQLVDLYPARAHLHSLTRSLEFMLGDRKTEWLAARLDDLDYGDIDGIEAADRAYPLEGVKKNETEKGTGLLPQQRAPDALPLVPLTQPVRRLRRRRGQLQDGRRAKAQAGRHALDRRRRRRHHRPPLPAGGSTWEQASRDIPARRRTPPSRVLGGSSGTAAHQSACPNLAGCSPCAR